MAGIVTPSRTLGASLAKTWQRTADYFVPPETAADRDAGNRARMFLISHTIGPILGNSVPIALFAFDPTPQADVLILALSISLFWGFPFLLRWGVSYSKLVLLSVVNLNFAILWSCYHYGGVASPTLTWVLIIPMLSLFYVGSEQRLQPWLLAITAASFLAFFAAYSAFRPPSNDVPAAAMLALGAVSTVATLAYVATMAIYYAKVFDAGVDLEIEVRRRRAMAEELRAAVALAYRTGSAKSEFLARMSHEIRTPLNAIIGYGDLLLEEAEEADDPLMRADVMRILDAANYLVRLINMILDLAKIEAGRMVFDVHPHRLETLIDRAVEGRRQLLADQQNAVEITVEKGLETVEVDEHRLLQVIGSILENAAIHTRGGTIGISASRAFQSTRPAFRVGIADTGAGIPPEMLPSIFETFATAQHASAGRYGGTGLNLAVCSQLCRAMGGRVEVQSSLGAGSTFTVTLPMQARTADRERVADAAGAARLGLQDVRQCFPQDRLNPPLTELPLKLVPKHRGLPDVRQPGRKVPA